MGANIMQIIQNNLYAVIAIGAVLILSLLITLTRLRKIKHTSQSFLAQHPEAAKIYLTSRGLITSEAVTVYSVNGAAPQHFAEPGKTGFYVLPGKTTVEISYAHNRPGVVYQNVTTTTDVVQKVLETQPYQSYLLSFDRKEECFTFEELAG